MGGISALLLLSGAAGAVAQGAPSVMVRADSPLGAILTDAAGRTVYVFARDVPGLSNCVDQCATSWPPLTTQSDPTAADGLDGVVATTVRPDGSNQVTYNGMPLYYWSGDAAPGDTNGQGVAGVWSVVNPSPAPTVNVRTDADLGPILVDASGMTLYVTSRDSAGVSTCVDQCATNWPPLLSAGDPTGPDQVTGGLGTISRADSPSPQVTYNGMPLYHWSRDSKPGDKTGQNVAGVWSAAAP